MDPKTFQEHKTCYETIYVEQDIFSKIVHQEHTYMLGNSFQEHDWISSNPKQTFLEKILKVAEKMGTARVKRDIQFYKEELKVTHNVK